MALGTADHLTSKGASAFSWLLASLALSANVGWWKSGDHSQASKFPSDDPGIQLLRVMGTRHGRTALRPPFSTGACLELLSVSAVIPLSPVGELKTALLGSPRA